MFERKREKGQKYRHLALFYLVVTLQMSEKVQHLNCEFFIAFFFLYSKKVLSLLHELTMNVLCKSRHMYKRASKSSGKIGNKNGSFSQILKNVSRILRISNFHCICL